MFIFGVTFASACVWLTIRIINRRERWAKRTLVALIVLPVLYVASIGPAQWLWVYAVPDSLCPQCRKAITTLYSPLTSLAEHSDLLDRTVGAYLGLWIDRDEVVDRLKEEFRQKWEKRRRDPEFKVDMPEPFPPFGNRLSYRPAIPPPRRFASDPPTLLLILAASYAAVLIWLMVRIINRKERWAKRTLAVSLALPVLYVASFGPACWITASVAIKQPVPEWMVIYYPLGIHAARGPKPTREALLWWMTLFAKRGTNVWVPIDRQPTFWFTPVPS